MRYTDWTSGEPVEKEWLDPDPLRPPETDDIITSAAFVAGYDTGYRDGASLATVRALFLGLLIGVAAALGGIALAVHRS